jgi:hypothetical protein
MPHYIDQLFGLGIRIRFDAIEQYQLIANGQQFYTQNNAIEESYITGLATTEAVKKSDVFRKLGTLTCGTELIPLGLERSLNYLKPKLLLLMLYWLQSHLILRSTSEGFYHYRTSDCFRSLLETFRFVSRFRQPL